VRVALLALLLAGCTLLPQDVGRDRAIEVAEAHNPGGQVTGSRYGRLGDFVHDPAAIGAADFGPGTWVWAITFEESMTICRPDGSGCFSRMGYVIAYVASDGRFVGQEAASQP
jgi:hypothetical protein